MKNYYIIGYFLLFSTPLFFCYCSTTQRNIETTAIKQGQSFRATITVGEPADHDKNGVKRRLISAVYADLQQNGTYKKINLGDYELPEPIQGVENFMIAIYQAINYPASARERGIQGKVVVTVVFDESGEMRKTFISQHSDQSLDRESLGIIKKANKCFTQLIIDGGTVPFKVDIPISFNLFQD